MLFYQLISHQRKALGISQSELAFQSGLSLPTIQKLESGSGNPSLETLQALLTPLGFGFYFRPRGADWDYLEACGLPLAKESKETSKTRAGVHLHSPKLLAELRAALVEVSATEKIPRGGNSISLLDGRKKEALLALLLALKLHYPKIYQKLRRSELLLQFEKSFDHPRLIKLKRLALSGLSKFL